MARERRSKGGKGGGQNNSMKSLGTLAVILIVCAAVSFHFRGKVSKYVFPLVFKPQVDKKKIDNVGIFGGEIQALGFANYLEKKGGSADGIKCCWKNSDFQALHETFCSGPSVVTSKGEQRKAKALDFFTDSVGVLVNCGRTLQGRMELSDEFTTLEYTGKIRGGSRGLYTVVKAWRTDEDEEESGSGSRQGHQAACDLLDHCTKRGSDKICREVKRTIGTCEDD